MTPTVGQISADLEAASLDNLEAYEETGSAGIASERCGNCDRPLVISSYGTWFDSRPTYINIHHMVCCCQEGKD